MKSVIAIENALPRELASARENLDEVLAKPGLEEAIRNANGAAEFLEGDVVTAFHDVSDAALQAQFRASTKLAGRAVCDYAGFLKTKLPKADQNFALGRERYRKLLAGELVTLPPDALLDLGTRELRREQERFAAAGAQLTPAASRRTFSPPSSTSIPRRIA